MHSLLPWRMPFINLRSHKKVLLVDGVVGFTGGMNIADENVMATQPRRCRCRICISGSRVRWSAQLAEAFAEDWAFVTGEDLDGDAWSPKIAPA